jgi:hypothetical protein
MGPARTCIAWPAASRPAARSSDDQEPTRRPIVYRIITVLCLAFLALVVYGQARTHLTHHPKITCSWTATSGQCQSDPP